MQANPRKLLLASGLVALLSGASGLGTHAEAADLAGSWRGAGTVVYTSGEKERARCRATVKPSGKNAYDINATCATQSGTVSQIAFVRGNGSSFHGTFHNPEFDTDGVITISVSGRSATARLNSSKGSAVLRLNK